MAILVSGSGQNLPILQRIVQDYKPKLKELTMKYPRISFHIDDKALAANLPDVISKVGFMTQPPSMAQSGKTLVQYLVHQLASWLKSGDLVLIHYQPQPNAANLTDILRELKRKSPFIVKIGLIPIFISTPSSAKQQQLFRLLGQFDIRYAIFIPPGATLENHIETVLEELARYNSLLKNNFESYDREEPPHAPSVEPVNQYRSLLDMADEAMHNGRFEAAIEIYTKAIELNADFHSLMKRGDAHYKSRQYVPALNDYREANRLEMMKPDPYARIGACCFKIIQDPEAKKDPEKVRRMATLGVKYVSDAENMITKMIKENVRSPEKLPPEPYSIILNALVDSDIRGMGLTDEESKLSAIATRALERTTEINAENSDVDVDTRIDRAILLTRNKYYDEAELIFRDVIDKAPQHAGPAFNNFAVELRKNSQFGKSFEIYLELLKYPIPDKDIVIENMKTAGRRNATTLAAGGKYDEAVRVYNEILNQMPLGHKGREWILCDIAVLSLSKNDQATAASRLVEAVFSNANLAEEPEFKRIYSQLIPLWKEVFMKMGKAAI